MNLIAKALDLHARAYPDVSATALLALRRVERLRRHPGYERARHWGVGPHHEELQRLGLATFGDPDSTNARPVDMTDDGRIVADMLEGLRLGELRPERCRCCGQLLGRDDVAPYCGWCADQEIGQ